MVGGGKRVFKAPLRCCVAGHTWIEGLEVCMRMVVSVECRLRAEELDEDGGGGKMVDVTA